MGQRTQYTPGTFSWADLGTTDQKAATAFYSGLFGWEADDQPIDDQGNVYSMMKLGGESVAAISLQSPMERDAGAPPAWHSYVTVESADDTAAKAKEQGANVVAEPFDVLTAGRMAVIADPQGAFFFLWEPRDHIGATLVNAAGALAWNELSSPDLDASKSFYGGVFGWTFDEFEENPEPYFVIKNADRANGGIRELNQPGPPPNWLAYFGIDEIEAGIAKVEELGGSKHVGPIDIGVAKIAVVADPQGAMFALYAGQMEE